MNKLQAFFPYDRAFLLIFISVIAVYGLSFYKRQATYSYWMENSQEYVVENVTAMSDNDSYFWLRMARELDAGHLGKGKVDPTKGYPDLTPLAINDTPSLLAEFISFGKNFTGGDYYRSGLLLIPILAGLFVFPLYFYFNRLGFGASAVMGGLVGSFSNSYYGRTTMGRVDTDLLNTFFLFAVACFILPINRDKSWRNNIALSAGAGLTMYLFIRWYQQPSFILVYLFFMAIHLLIGRAHWKQVAPILAVFLLASGPMYLLQSAESLRIFLVTYVSPPPTGQIVWPDVMQVITEGKHRTLEGTLRHLYGFLPMVFAGFAGLIYLYFRHFRQMIPVTPIFILGAWSLAGPIRFSMYLAPLIGIGVGVLIELLMKFIGEKARLRRLLVPLASISLMFILFFSTAAFTGYPHSTPPILSASTTRALLDIKSMVPKHSAMFTPFWDLGYPLMEIGDFATYHDGGTQGGIRTTLAGKALISPRQKDMVSLLSYLEDYGFRQLSTQLVKDNIPADKMMKMVFDYPGEFRGENVYVLYLEDMIWKVWSMSVLGTWDFEKKISDPMDYVELHCFSITNNVMTCRDGKIDLNRGFMNDGTTDIPLSAALFVNDGYVVDQKYYDHDGGYYLQVLMKNNKTVMILVADERLFLTNFNQQYLLGNYDRRYFEEVYNNFPVARVLKVKRAEAGDPAQ
jgi:dolichyl-diphosphooligosaccharide--protein glycosyltransferase